MAENEVKAEPIRKISIICSKGTLDMAYPGLILANAARMVGIEVNLFFTFWGLDIITQKKTNKLKFTPVGNPAAGVPQPLGLFMTGLATRMMKKQIEALDAPPVPEFIEMLADSGAHLYACQMSLDMMKLTPTDLVDQVEEVLGAIEFYERSAGAQIIFI